MAIDFNALIKLADLRSRIADGYTPTAAEMHDLLDDLRRGRETAAKTAAKQRRQAAAVNSNRQGSLDLERLFTTKYSS